MLFAYLSLMLLGSSAAPPPDREDEPAPVQAAPQQHEHARRKDKDEEDDDDRPQQTGPIVVTGRRLDAARTRIDEGLGATVYALTNDAIENRPGGEFGSLAAILTQAPGVTLSGRGLAVRGARGAQIRINDIVLPEAVSDPADRLSSRLADTTRLITGTLPAQFAFAPAGVIAVNTKNGLYEHGGQAELFAATNGMVEPAFEWAGSSGATSLFGSGSFEHDRSFVADASGRTTRDRRDELGGLAFADHLIGANDRLSLILGGSLGRDRIGATSLGPGTERDRDGYAVAAWQHSDGGFTFQSAFFAGGSIAESDFGVGTAERRTSIGTQIDASDTIGAHVLRGGLLLDRARSHEQAPGAAASPLFRTSLGVYAQDEWKLAQTLTFNPGVRLDWLRGLGADAAVEPRASLIWNISKGTTAHIGYARYAAVPPLGDERPRIALPDERDDVLDAGLQQRFGALTLGADAYSRWVRNLLTERIDPGSALRTAFAYGRARLRGVELSALYAEGPLSAWANLAFSRGRGRILVGGQGLFGPATVAALAAHWTPLAADRPVVGSAGLVWRIGSLSLSGDVTASSGAPRTANPDNPDGARTPAYAVLGLAAVTHLTISGKSLDLRADILNLTDVRSRTNDASVLEGGWTRFVRGRALTVGIEQSF